MASEKRTFALAEFFSLFFHSFPKLLLTNLLFAVPFAVFFCIFWLINTLSGLNLIFVYFLTIIPLFPFYAGVTQVTSHIVRNDNDVSVLHNFFSGVKDNFLRFFLHGIVLYIAIFFSYYSIMIYSRFGAKNGIFYLFMVFCIIISVFFLFMFFYLPPMTVTFDISLKNIYKNSALMTFGELKHNIFAVFGLFVISLFCATLIIFCNNPILVIVVTAILALFLLPSVVSFVINSAIYKSMYSMISDKDAKSAELNKKIEDKRNARAQGAVNEDNTEILEDYSDLDIDENCSPDEYIFYKGKMIKKSVIIKIKNDAQQKESE